MGLEDMLSVNCNIKNELFITCTVHTLKSGILFKQNFYVTTYEHFLNLRSKVKTDIFARGAGAKLARDVGLDLYSTVVCLSPW